MSSLGIALKEWAVICKAIVEGGQAILLRKGGIAESGGSFRVEQKRFWLYPTYVHQQQSGIIDGARPTLDEAIRERPPEGVVRLSHFAEVPCVYHIDDLNKALKLAHLHIWSRETVEARFHYRTPGLFVLPVRVYEAATVHELPETAEYAGCKSWVQLGCDLDATGEPLLDEESFDAIVNELDRLLEPTAMA
jgi:hypothetical protein